MKKKAILPDSQSTISFASLPPEIVDMILAKIDDIKSVYAAHQVNKLWYELTKSRIDNLTICCGDFHYLLLSPSKELYVWGNNGFGQLGLGKKIGNLVRSPHAIDLKSHGIDTIKKIYACGDHSFLITTSGRLFAWGRNDRKLLGLGHNSAKIIWTPLEVDLQAFGINSIKDFYSSRHHTLIITQSNQLFTWGYNHYDQLGINRQFISPHTPQAIPAHKYSAIKIKKIYIGNDHNFIQSNANKLFAWGNNQKGQLGLGRQAGYVVKTPTAVDLKAAGIDDIQQIYPGENHTFLVTRSNKLFAWGDNQYYQLGTNQRNKSNNICKIVYTPLQIDLKPFGIDTIQSVYPCVRHTFLLTKSGKLLAWGTNYHGQLGPVMNNTYSFFKRYSEYNRASDFSATPLIFNLQDYGIDKVRNIHSCYCNTILVTTRGDLFAWGNNRYSNMRNASYNHTKCRIFNTPQPFKIFNDIKTLNKVDNTNPQSDTQFGCKLS